MDKIDISVLVFLEGLALEYLDFDLKSEALHTKASNYIWHRCMSKLSSSSKAAIYIQ